MTEVNVTDAIFQQEVIEKSKELPVLVDFWASWCGPCQMLGPILEKIAKDYEGKIVVAKVSVETDNARQIGVYSAPGQFAIFQKMKKIVLNLIVGQRVRGLHVKFG